METELAGIVIAVVLPVYPLLVAIYQKIGRYDEIAKEFERLRSEHERFREVHHAE